jgi:hypothetical protein
VDRIEKRCPIADNMVHGTTIRTQVV